MGCKWIDPMGAAQGRGLFTSIKFWTTIVNHYILWPWDWFYVWVHWFGPMSFVTTRMIFIQWWEGSGWDGKKHPPQYTHTQLFYHWLNPAWCVLLVASTLRACIHECLTRVTSGILIIWLCECAGIPLWVHAGSWGPKIDRTSTVFMTRWKTTLKQNMHM